MNSLVIFDDSRVLADCWAKWIKSAFQCETQAILPGDDWQSRLEGLAPFALIVDATSQRIPIEEVINVLCADPRFAQTRVILSCGYAENLELLLVKHAKRLGTRCTALRKPITQHDFTEQLTAFFSESDARPKTASGSPDASPKMKNIFGEKSASTAADRFGWLEKEGAIMAFAITLPNGTAGLQGGKDCGDLPQGGSYFRDLASQIGSELGIDQLKELQVGCEGCRLLSAITADGHHVDILAGPTSDLPTLSRAIKESK
jgi:hypothetical protein